MHNFCLKIKRDRGESYFEMYYRMVPRNKNELWIPFVPISLKASLSSYVRSEVFAAVTEESRHSSSLSRLNAVSSAEC
jgi:hypothetical protein